MSELVENPTPIATAFQRAIIEEIERQANSANIHDLISKQIESVMKETIERAFRTYGDVGKQIEKAIIDSLQIGDRLNLPSYSTMIMALLRQKLEERVNDLVASKLDAEMNEILSIAPKELKISALVEAVVSAAEEDYSNHGEYITFNLEEDERYGWYNIAIDKDGRTSNRDCEIQITISKDGAILSCKIDNQDPKATVRMGGMWGYQKMVFGAYCCGSKIILDDMDPPTYIGGH